VESFHERTFQEIKAILINLLFLAHYDPKQILIIAADDASSIGISDVLLRHPDDQAKAVFQNIFHQKTLTKTQQDYNRIEKKALAVHDNGYRIVPEIHF